MISDSQGATTIKYHMLWSLHSDNNNVRHTSANKNIEQYDLMLRPNVRPIQIAQS